VKGATPSLLTIGASFRRGAVQRSRRLASGADEANLIRGNDSQALVDHYATCPQCASQNYGEARTRRGKAPPTSTE
jgi:hypothetical protein